jgi:hypothetical protein
LIDQAKIALTTAKIVREPLTFYETWNCEDHIQRKKWREELIESSKKLTIKGCGK